MRKPIIFIITLLLFSAFLFVSPRNSYAGCEARDATDGCVNKATDCGNGNCCDFPSECFPASNPPGGGVGDSTPGGGGGTSPGDQSPGGGTSPLKGDCIDTAVGCIPINNAGFTGFILRWAIGIGGGVAFLLIILASFQMMTSQGDPKRLQAGQELLASALMGLILLIFSAFILRVIGVDLFGIIK